MSSYYLKAKNKLTGVIIQFQALDNHFGHHKYGHQSQGENGIVYTEEEFKKLFERID